MFPSGLLSPHEVSWFSERLRALGERPLELDGLETFRFTWLRTFHAPVAVRFESLADYPALLTVKMLEGSEPERRKVERSFELPRLAWQSFQQLVAKAAFWTMPARLEDQTGRDGADWLLEGVLGGRYHLVLRWSPKHDPSQASFSALCSRLIELAQLGLPEREIY